MRILILLRDFSPNGITTYNRILANELRHQGHEVIVWPSDDSTHSGRCLRMPILHPVLEPLMRRTVARLRPDLIYANHYTQARIAHRLRQTLGIPWFACMHNGHSPRRMAQWAELFGNVSGIVTMCQTLHERYTQLVEASTRPTFSTPPPVLLSRLPITQPALAKRSGADISIGIGVAGDDGPLTLAYCSRLSGSKGPRCEAWLRAIATLPELARHHLMVIGGGAHLTQLQRVAQQLKLQVEFTGMVPDTAPYLQRVDVMTGAGYALMEGLIRGRSGVALGFGGCFGAITPARLDEAFAINFADHCPQALPSDSATIAAELLISIRQRGSEDARLVTERCQSQFAPTAITSELLRFFKTAAPAAAEG